MPKVYHLKAEQIAKLRNNLIISEALEDETVDNQTANLADDYNDYALKSINQERPEGITQGEKTESEIYGDVTRGLYNYARNYNLANKIAQEIERSDPKIINPVAAQFIEKLLYGIYQMANDPSQNVAFNRFLRSIGVTLDADLLTKGTPIMEGMLPNGIFYRAEHKYVGATPTFTPRGFYEKANPEGNPVFHNYDPNMHMESDVPEIAASKTIGGAILGAWSIKWAAQQHYGNDNAQPIKRVFIYKIIDKPSIDISSWNSYDFPWLQEVRFRKPVQGEYLGAYNYTTEDFDRFSLFYDTISMADEDTVPDNPEEWDNMKNNVNTMHQYLQTKSV